RLGPGQDRSVQALRLEGEPALRRGHLHGVTTEGLRQGGCEAVDDVTFGHARILALRNARHGAAQGCSGFSSIGSWTVTESPSNSTAESHICRPIASFPMKPGSQA